MKRAVLSGVIAFLCILSIAQVPEFTDLRAIQGNLPGLRFPNLVIKGNIFIPSTYLPNTLILSNAKDSLFRIRPAIVTSSRNNEIRNTIYGRGNNLIIFHNIESVPDLTEIMGNPTFERISMRGFYITFAGKSDLVSGIYFDILNKTAVNVVGGFQDRKGDKYTLVPGWKSGQYLPLLNLPGNNSLEWRYFGTFPVRPKHSSKPEK
jgi:hypothetical protein